MKKRLDDQGRAVIRYSGTEPVLRLMIEGADKSTIQKELDDLTRLVTKELT